MLLSCIIHAREERYVTVINIPNAFIQTRIEHEKDMATINIHGILVDMLWYIAPDVYEPWVTTYRKGIKELITQYINAINGNMVASLLYYWNCCKTLKLNKFKMRPYDPCVANILVNGLQLSIIFHVDDCKLIHKYTKVNDSFIWLLRE